MKVLIGATNSGCGKTTITAGILRALKRRGLKVQPFKCGPDFIDTQYHCIAADNESVNLDTWMARPGHVREVFAGYAKGADACVVEGVMGLFDGYDRSEGSCAAIARLLGLPVVLIVNAKSMAYSVAPLLYGFSRFDTSINVAGVIFNRVGSARHASFLRQACEDVGTRCLGCLPNVKDLSVPSRHLGLTLENRAIIERMADRAADLIEEHVDIDRLMSEEPLNPQLSTLNFQPSTFNLQPSTFNLQPSTFNLQPSTFNLQPSTFNLQPSPLNLQPSTFLTVAVARDEAFNFIYRENIDNLRRIGKVTYFSPLQDQSLPQADIVYIPGGYPEFFLPQLSANTAMRESIRKHVENGGRLLAECGGMMYLCRAVTDEDDKSWPLCGILQQESTMQGKRLHLGYRRFMLGGAEWRGHEFHYSSVPQSDKASTLPVVQLDASGNTTDTPLYRYKNAIASYTHLYFGDNDIRALFRRE